MLPYRRLFEDAQWALLITDRDGEVQGFNQRARKVLGPFVAQPGVHCCELLGCQTPGTVLATGCVTQLARAMGREFPEVRVDLPHRAVKTAPSAAWVVGAPLPGEDELVVLQLRPAELGDRRRRTQPHWMRQPLLRIHALGPTQVETADGTLGGSWLGHRPGQILKYLTLRRGRLVSLDELLEVFTETGQRRTSGSIRQAVHVLRDHLEPTRRRHDPSAFVQAARGGYQLSTEQLWVDIDAFETHARDGTRAKANGDLVTAEHHLTEAVALHRGELMSDEPYSEWVLTDRNRLRDLMGQSLRSLVELRAGADDVAAATRYMITLSELEPLDLDVQKEMLRMILRSGRYAEAERRLGVVRARFRRRLGEDPDVDLAALRREP